MNKMNQQVREEWIAALESGQYHQGRTQLRQGNMFCCLGVLCDIAAKHGIGHWENDTFVTETDIEISVLPKEVVEWAGLASNNPPVADGDSLSIMNDDGVPFGIIASFIRQVL